MTAATKRAPAPKPAEKSALEYLQDALDDLARAREQAQQDVRAGIDSAVERIRGVRKDLGARAHDEADELQTRLEHASDDALKEFGRAAIRAQRTPGPSPRCRRRSAAGSGSSSSDPPNGASPRDLRGGGAPSVVRTDVARRPARMADAPRGLSVEACPYEPISISTTCCWASAGCASAWSSCARRSTRTSCSARGALFPLPLVDHQRPVDAHVFPEFRARPVAGLEGRRLALIAGGGRGRACRWSASGARSRRPGSSRP